MSHHVLVGLPDDLGGQTACADYRQPIVHVMRRINQQLANGKPGRREDYELIREWLEFCPEQACSPRPPFDSCTHGPAQPDPGFEPPRYKRPPAAIMADKQPGMLL